MSRNAGDLLRREDSLVVGDVNDWVLGCSMILTPSDSSSWLSSSSEISSESISFVNGGCVDGLSPITSSSS
jgi:hypothetical protein